MAQITHGITVEEIPTSIVGVYPIDNPPVVIGRAPIHTVSGVHYVNTPRLYNNYASAVSEMGDPTNNPWGNSWGIMEMFDAYFIEYNLQQLVVINVFDPAKHFTIVGVLPYTAVNGQITLPDSVITPSLTVLKAGTALTYQTDYLVTYLKGQTVITLISALNATATLSIGYNKADPSKVTQTDIIGGIDGVTGARSGLQCLDQIYSIYNVVPSTLVIPNFSQLAPVSIAAAAIMSSINGCFKGRVAVDVDTLAAPIPTSVPLWKGLQNISGTNIDLLWPQQQLGDKVFHYSTIYASLLAYTDKVRGNGLPYFSPSNKQLAVSNAYLNGAPYSLDKSDADYLNSNGIITSLLWNQVYRCWGNYTSAFPGLSTDPHDMWIPVKRMFDYVGNVIVENFFSFVDEPASPRLIQTLLESLKGTLNAWVSQGALNSADVAFNASENPISEMLIGHFTFHVMLGGLVPAQWLDFKLEFDINSFNALFNAPTALAA